MSKDHADTVTASFTELKVCGLVLMEDFGRAQHFVLHSRSPATVIPASTVAVLVIRCLLATEAAAVEAVILWIRCLEAYKMI